jgi:hypothetical protein
VALLPEKIHAGKHLALANSEFDGDGTAALPPQNPVSILERRADFMRMLCREIAARLFICVIYAAGNNDGKFLLLSLLLSQSVEGD